MNTRLRDAYTAMQAENKEKFLQNNIALSHDWNKPIWGITLQIELGQAIKALISKYQMELNELEPNNLLLIPSSAQHISFNQVVFWDGEYARGREKTWEGIQGSFLAEFQKLDHVFPEFDVTFSGLVATTSAIVWCGYDKTDEFEHLREEFLQRLPFPSETKTKNHIIHTTVVRYKNKLSNPEAVFRYLSTKQDSATMRVKKIVLKRELVFPSLQTETISEIELIPVP